MKKMCGFQTKSLVHWYIQVSMAVCSLAMSSGASTQHDEPVACPPQDVTLTMTGAPAGNDVIGAWTKIYSTEFCPGFNITFDTNEWDAGAARVCDSSLVQDSVDIASMSGAFFPPQASTIDGWNFQCRRSKQARETILLQLGYRGITVGIGKDGSAAQCIELLGGGLSKDQLRWIYSSYSAKELIATGWDPSSVPFLDNDDSTHLWSEIHENCTSAEILIAAEENTEANGDKNGAIDYFYERVLTGREEVMRDHFSAPIDRAWELDEYVRSNDASISFYHLYDMFGGGELQDRDVVVVGIKDAKGFVYLPTMEYFESNSYPLMRKFFIGVVNEPLALQNTRPLLEFGYSSRGTEILKEAGYWPIHESEKRVMYTLLGSELGFEHEDIEEHCRSSDVSLDIGGDDILLEIFNAWSRIYRIRCPLTLEREAGTSELGAFLLCGYSASNDAIEVALTTRNFDSVTDAVQRRSNDFVYDCIEDEEAEEVETRSVIQIEVALDGIAIVFSMGDTSIGQECVELMGGLTKDQLRWMYSSYSEIELEKSGWDPKCLGNSDFDSSTHLWSELDSRCAEEEIRLSGDYKGGASFVQFSQLVLNDYDNGEHIATDRPKPYIEATGINLWMAARQHDDLVSYIEYHHYFEHQDAYWPAPVASEAGAPFVVPSQASLADRSYPLTHSIFVNVLNDAYSLENVAALLSLGFAHPSLLQELGFAPILGDRMTEMFSRVTEGPYESTMDDQTDDDDESGNRVGLILGSVAAALLGSVLVGVLYMYGCKGRRHKR